MKKITGLILVFFGLSISSCGLATPTATPRPTLTPSPEISSVAIAGFTEGVTQLAWNPQGTQLASTGRGPEDTTIHILNADGQPVRVLAGHSGPILSLAWSPDGSQLASGSADQTVRLWKADGSLDKTMDINQGKVW